MPGDPRVDAAWRKYHDWHQPAVKWDERHGDDFLPPEHGFYRDEEGNLTRSDADTEDGRKAMAMGAEAATKYAVMFPGGDD